MKTFFHKEQRQSGPILRSENEEKAPDIMKLPTQRVVHDLGPIGTFLLASRTLVLQVTERDLLQVKRGIFLERKKKRGGKVSPRPLTCYLLPYFQVSFVKIADFNGIRTQVARV